MKSNIYYALNYALVISVGRMDGMGCGGATEGYYSSNTKDVSLGWTAIVMKTE